MNRTISEKEVACPVCSEGSYYWTTVEESAYEIHQVTDRETNKKKFHLYKCKRCGHGFFEPGVNAQAELSSFYNQNYARDYVESELNERFLQRKKQYQLDINLAQKYLSSDKITVEVA